MLVSGLTASLSARERTFECVRERESARVSVSERVSESAFKSVRESVLVSEKMCVRACVNVDESRERDSTCEKHTRARMVCERQSWECVGVCEKSVRVRETTL